MKILITADLHYQEHWFRWLLDRAADYDLICIAGDLLDMFSREPRIVQAREVGRWIRELVKVTRVAICSGNHDDAGRQISADRAPVYEWLVALGKEPNIITDGVTQVVNDLIVTTVPYHCSKEQKSVWLDRGNTLRRQRRSSMACPPPCTTEGLSWFYWRGTRGGRTSPHLPSGIFYFRAQSSISLLGGKRVGRKWLRESMCSCRDSF